MVVRGPPVAGGAEATERGAASMGDNRRASTTEVQADCKTSGRNNKYVITTAGSKTTIDGYKYSYIYSSTALRLLQMKIRCVPSTTTRHMGQMNGGGAATRIASTQAPQNAVCPHGSNACEHEVQRRNRNIGT